MSDWFGPVWRVMRSESGSSSLQHAALMALVVTVCLGGVQAFGTAVQNYFQRSDAAFSLASDDGVNSVSGVRVRGRRLGQNVPQVSLEERLSIAQERKAQRIAELRERAASQQR